MQELVRFLNEQQHAKTIYPPAADMLAAFNQTPFDRVKVVIIGQDPYHGVGTGSRPEFLGPSGRLSATFFDEYPQRVRQ